jgi:hypothetical protein
MERWRSKHPIKERKSTNYWKVIKDVNDIFTRGRFSTTELAEMMRDVPEQRSKGISGQCLPSGSVVLDIDLNKTYKVIDHRDPNLRLYYLSELKEASNG